MPFIIIRSVTLRSHIGETGRFVSPVDIFYTKNFSSTEQRISKEIQFLPLPFCYLSNTVTPRIHPVLSVVPQATIMTSHFSLCSPHDGVQC